MKRFVLTIVIAGGLTTAIIIAVVLNLHKKDNQPQKNIIAPQTKVTIIEGWTIKDIAADLNFNKNRPDAPHLAGSDEFTGETLTFPISDYPILSSKPSNKNLEGFLFPDTYFLPLPSTSTNESQLLIKKALDNFSKKFTAQMEQDAKNGHMSVYEIVTLASIIEKETGLNALTAEQKAGLDEERKIIAGIFYNRLNLGMPLQSDATVNYITGKNTPAISGEDSQIDSPYNTYKFKGLPPGPISNPSLSALKAAIYPASTDYLYFLSDPVTGKSIFAKTYEEHLKNKQKYLR